MFPRADLRRPRDVYHQPHPEGEPCTKEPLFFGLFPDWARLVHPWPLKTSHLNAASFHYRYLRNGPAFLWFLPSSFLLVGRSFTIPRPLGTPGTIVTTSTGVVIGRMCGPRGWPACSGTVTPSFVPLPQPFPLHAYMRVVCELCMYSGSCWCRRGAAMIAVKGSEI